MLSRASPKVYDIHSEDMPEEDWGLRLATMQRQLEAAEEGQLSSWFGELESDTLDLLEKMGGS